MDFANFIKQVLDILSIAFKSLVISPKTLTTSWLCKTISWF